MFLQKLTIENFRSLVNLELPFTTTDGNPRKWTLILGQNGTGKSSILQALALLLAGSEALPELLGDVDSWIRQGKSEARVAADVLTADGNPSHIELNLRRGHGIRDLFKDTEAGLGALDRALEQSNGSYFTIGYGVSRRLSSGTSSATTNDVFRQPRAQSVATLFSPDATLNPLEDWAIDLDYQRDAEGRQIIKNALAGLLPGIEFETIDREKRQLLFKTPDGTLPLSQLGDGCQTIAAWCGDLLYRITDVFEDFQDPLAVRGLLLIDEIDLHLHPVWSRQLIQFLTAKLPNLQIIATTNSLFIAQQTGEGQLYSLRREKANDSPTLYPFPGVPRNLMLHQLIMSPIFGLSTTDSKAVEDMKNEYRTLKAKPSLSKKEQERLDELTDQIKDLPDWNAETPHQQRQRELLERIQQKLGTSPRKS